MDGQDKGSTGGGKMRVKIVTVTTDDSEGILDLKVFSSKELARKWIDEQDGTPGICYHYTILEKGVEK